MSRHIDPVNTMNVGRFHPLDKTIQFLGDSLPFLLLGVGPEVIAAYFVFYAVNGFYQHSNADVRLGFLNWIVAGPELHRWHHSTIISEGHANYGNNLIIWDTFFGTRLLPKERTVSEVGIGNKKWSRRVAGESCGASSASHGPTAGGWRPQKACLASKALFFVCVVHSSQTMSEVLTFDLTEPSGRASAKIVSPELLPFKQFLVPRGQPMKPQSSEVRSK